MNRVLGLPTLSSAAKARVGVAVAHDRFINTERVLEEAIMRSYGSLSNRKKERKEEWGFVTGDEELECQNGIPKFNRSYCLIYHLL